MADKEYDSALELTRREGFVYLTTLDKGFPETRVVFNLLMHRAEALASGAGAVPCDFANYIGTNTSSRKTAQIREDDRVCLYYSDNVRFKGCMVRGRAREVTDGEIRASIWTPSWDQYYKGGLDGGDFSLFLFIPEHIRYYHGLKVTAFNA